MRALLITLSSCHFQVDGSKRGPKEPPDPATHEVGWDTTSHTSGGTFEGDWTGTWTLTADYTVRCDLGSEFYHQIFFVDVEDRDGTLVIADEDYQMEGPDGPALELFGTFPLSGHREEVRASTDEDDTRIRLSAELLSDYRAEGRLEGAFVDLEGDLCELEEAYVEMLR